MMMVWQLMNILSGQKDLIKQLENYGPSSILPQGLVVALLSQSHEVFSVCKDNYLRSNPANYAFDVQAIEVLSTTDAYRQFGGTALCEVLDFGSWKIKQ